MVFNKFRDKGIRLIWLAFVILLIDRFTKYWAISKLTYAEPLKILPVLNFTLTYNKGAAFSFLHAASGWQHWVLGGFAVAVSISVIVWLFNTSYRDYLLNIALCAILGGALGNVCDRVLYGFVIDFISVHVGDWYFAIFNIADSAITIGSVLMLWHWLRQK